MTIRTLKLTAFSSPNREANGVLHNIYTDTQIHILMYTNEIEWNNSVWWYGLNATYPGGPLAYCDDVVIGDFYAATSPFGQTDAYETNNLAAPFDKYSEYVNLAHENGGNGVHNTSGGTLPINLGGGTYYIRQMTILTDLTVIFKNGTIFCENIEYRNYFPILYDYTCKIIIEADANIYMMTHNINNSAKESVGTINVIGNLFFISDTNQINTMASLALTGSNGHIHKLGEGETVLNLVTSGFAEPISVYNGKLTMQQQSSSTIDNSTIYVHRASIEIDSLCQNSNIIISVPVLPHDYTNINRTIDYCRTNFGSKLPLINLNSSSNSNIILRSPVNQINYFDGTVTYPNLCLKTFLTIYVPVSINLDMYDSVLVLYTFGTIGNINAHDSSLFINLGTTASSVNLHGTSYRSCQMNLFGTVGDVTVDSNSILYVPGIADRSGHTITTNPIANSIIVYGGMSLGKDLIGQTFVIPVLLTVLGNLTFGAGSELLWHLISSTNASRGTLWDAINVGGNTVITPTSKLWIVTSKDVTTSDVYTLPTTTFIVKDYWINQPIPVSSHWTWNIINSIGTTSGKFDVQTIFYYNYDGLIVKYFNDVKLPGVFKSNAGNLIYYYSILTTSPLLTTTSTEYIFQIDTISKNPDIPISYTWYVIPLSLSTSPWYDTFISTSANKFWTIDNNMITMEKSFITGNVPINTSEQLNFSIMCVVSDGLNQLIVSPDNFVVTALPLTGKFSFSYQMFDTLMAGFYYQFIPIIITSIPADVPTTWLCDHLSGTGLSINSSTGIITGNVSSSGFRLKTLIIIGLDQSGNKSTYTTSISAYVLTYNIPSKLIKGVKYTFPLLPDINSIDPNHTSLMPSGSGLYAKSGFASSLSDLNGDWSDYLYPTTNPLSIPTTSEMYLDSHSGILTVNFHFDSSNYIATGTQFLISFVDLRRNVDPPFNDTSQGYNGAYGFSLTQYIFTTSVYTPKYNIKQVLADTSNVFPLINDDNGITPPVTTDLIFSTIGDFDKAKVSVNNFGSLLINNYTTAITVPSEIQIRDNRVNTRGNLISDTTTYGKYTFTLDVYKLIYNIPNELMYGTLYTFNPIGILSSGSNITFALNLPSNFTIDTSGVISGVITDANTTFSITATSNTAISGGDSYLFTPSIYQFVYIIPDKLFTNTDYEFILKQKPISGTITKITTTLSGFTVNALLNVTGIFSTAQDTVVAINAYNSDNSFVTFSKNITVVDSTVNNSVLNYSVLPIGSYKDTYITTGSSATYNPISITTSSNNTTGISALNGKALYVNLAPNGTTFSDYIDIQVTVPSTITNPEIFFVSDSVVEGLITPLPSVVVSNGTPYFYFDSSNKKIVIKTNHFSLFTISETQNPTCLGENTEVLTPDGYVNVGLLKLGDYVLTGDGRKSQINNIQTNYLINEGKTLYLIPKDGIRENYPSMDTYLTYGHSVLVENNKYMMTCELPKYYPKIKPVSKSEILTIKVYHLHLENFFDDDLVINGGFIVESLGDGINIFTTDEFDFRTKTESMRY